MNTNQEKLISNQEKLKTMNRRIASIFVVAAAAVAMAVGLGYFPWDMFQTSQALFKSGKKYYEQKKYEEATIQLMNAVRKDPRHKEAGLLLSHILVASGNPGAAAKQLATLLEYYPDDATGNLELGNLYLADPGSDPGKFRQAHRLARKVLATDPTNVNALILSGVAEAHLSDFHASVNTLEKAISLDPQNPQALINLGAAQAVLKDFAAAEKSLIKAHEANPKDS